MADPDTARRMRDMQRQIDDLSVTLFHARGWRYRASARHAGAGGEGVWPVITRRAATSIIAALAASALLPRDSAADGSCPERGAFIRPIEDPIRRLLLIDLERYSGPTPAIVYTHPELLPAQRLIGLGGRGFRFEPISPGDPDAPYLWKIVPICRRPTL